MGLFSNIFDPGRKDRRRARRTAQQGIFSGGSLTGPGGISAGFNFADGRGTSTMSLGNLQPAQDALLQAGMGGLANIPGLLSQFQNIGQSSVDALGRPIDRMTTEQDFAGLGSIFQQAAGIAQRDPFDLGGELSMKLRQLSESRNQREVASMFDRLQRTGNLTSSAGMERAADVERGLFEQGLQFDVQGLQFGQQMIGDAFRRALGASQQREAIGARSFGEQTYGDTRAINQFNLASQMAQTGQELPLQLLGAGTGLSTLPLQFLQALTQAGGTASNSYMNAAGIHQQNASMAKSPFLEALNAAGSFASGIGYSVGG